MGRGCGADHGEDGYITAEEEEDVVRWAAQTQTRMQRPRWATQAKTKTEATSRTSTGARQQERARSIVNRNGRHRSFIRTSPTKHTSRLGRFVGYIRARRKAKAEARATAIARAEADPDNTPT